MGNKVPGPALGVFLVALFGLISCDTGQPLLRDSGPGGAEGGTSGGGGHGGRVEPVPKRGLEVLERREEAIQRPGGLEDWIAKAKIRTRMSTGTCP